MHLSEFFSPRLASCFGLEVNETLARVAEDIVRILYAVLQSKY